MKKTNDFNEEEEKRSKEIALIGAENTIKQQEELQEIYDSDNQNIMEMDITIKDFDDNIIYIDSYDPREFYGHRQEEIIIMI